MLGTHTFLGQNAAPDHDGFAEDWLWATTSHLSPGVAKMPPLGLIHRQKSQPLDQHPTFPDHLADKPRAEVLTQGTIRESQETT